MSQDTKKALLAIWDILYEISSQAQNYSDEINKDMQRAYALIKAIREDE